MSEEKELKESCSLISRIKLQNYRYLLELAKTLDKLVKLGSEVDENVVEMCEQHPSVLNLRKANHDAKVAAVEAVKCVMEMNELIGEMEAMETKITQIMDQSLREIAAIEQRLEEELVHELGRLPQGLRPPRLERQSAMVLSREG
jgi:hypothetical protein